MSHADILFARGLVWHGPGRGAVPGQVRDSDGMRRPEPLEVAFAGGRIAAIGADLADWRRPGTQVVDLAGEVLHAGLVDAHIHPIRSNLAATDRHPFAGPVSGIHAAKSVGTWVAGRCICPQGGASRNRQANLPDEGTRHGPDESSGAAGRW